MRKRVTLKFIAEQSGADIAIVSKVVNGCAQGKVSAEKRAKIEELIRKYNYAPLASARSMVTGKQRQIAFMLSSQTTLGLANSYYAMIMAGVYEICAEHGYQCVINVFDFSKVETFVMPENLRRMSIDGFVVTGFFDNANLQKLAEMELPLVTIGISHMQDAVPSVGLNRRQAYSAMLELAYERGHRRISVDNQEALKICQELAAGRTMELSSAETSVPSDSFLAGEKYAEVFAEMPETARPTFLYVNDHFAAAFLERAAQFGIHCPEDVSILSTDTPISRWTTPHLSILKEPVHEYGRRAAELLLDMVDGKTDLETAKRKAEEMQFPVSIQDRDSIRDLTITSKEKQKEKE